MPPGAEVKAAAVLRRDLIRNRYPRRLCPQKETACALGQYACRRGHAAAVACAPGCRHRDREERQPLHRRDQSAAGDLNALEVKTALTGRLLFVDNGSEFTGRLMDMWAYHHQVRIDFSRPGKPTDNGHVETFNGSLRDECLNVHWFESLAEAKAIVEAWRRDYNEVRPHSALMDLAPAEFVRQARVWRPIEGLVNAEN